MKIKNIIGTSIVLLGSSLGALVYAQNQTVTCPTLTANEVENVINNGTISTEQGYTLADEAGKTRAQVLIDEPTANPFDTYYEVYGRKTFNQTTYVIAIGNVLGKASYEAKERMKRILLNDEKIFNGVYDPQDNVCMYKLIEASPSISNYPFKTKFETVHLISIPNEENMPRRMMKKHRA